MEQVVEELEPLPQGVAAAATDEGLRGELEPVLESLEKKGWSSGGLLGASGLASATQRC